MMWSCHMDEGGETISRERERQREREGKRDREGEHKKEDRSRHAGK